MPIDPVRMNSDELYQILRTRLFEKLPAETTVKEVASGYADSIRKAKLQDITTASPEQFAADVESAYPFHPAIRDLYARFKENQGFQQTRALIRIMRIIVADLWNSGRADSLELVGAHNINLADPEMVSEVMEAEVKAMSDRHKAGAKYMMTIGIFSPTFGIIGAVFGLIATMAHLDDPSKLGEGIGAAFVATFWGVFLANGIFLPIANKLTSMSAKEVAYKRMIIEGVLSIQAGANPRLLDDLLRSTLPPKERGEDERKSA